MTKTLKNSQHLISQRISEKSGKDKRSTQGENN